MKALAFFKVNKPPNTQNSSFGDKSIYYIDRSVLLKNTSFIKFLQNYIRDPSGIFCEDIDGVISRICMVVCANSQ